MMKTDADIATSPPVPRQTHKAEKKYKPKSKTKCEPNGLIPLTGAVCRPQKTIETNTSPCPENEVNTTLLQILLSHRLKLPPDVKLSQSSQFQIFLCHPLELPPDVNLNQSSQLQTPLCYHNPAFLSEMRKIRHPVSRLLTKPHVNRLRLPLTNVTSRSISSDHASCHCPVE